MFCSLPRSDVKSMLVYTTSVIFTRKRSSSSVAGSPYLLVPVAGAMNLVGVILLFSSGKWKLWGTHKLVAVPVGVGWDEPMMGEKSPAVVRVHVRVRQSKTLHFPVARRKQEFRQNSAMVSRGNSPLRRRGMNDTREGPCKVRGIGDVCDRQEVSVRREVVRRCNVS